MPRVYALLLSFLVVIFNVLKIIILKELLKQICQLGLQEEKTEIGN